MWDSRKHYGYRSADRIFHSTTDIICGRFIHDESGLCLKNNLIGRLIINSNRGVGNSQISFVDVCNPSVRAGQ